MTPIESIMPDRQTGRLPASFGFSLLFAQQRSPPSHQAGGRQGRGISPCLMRFA